MDKNEGADYSVEQLALWKLTAERAASERLLGAADKVKWNTINNLIFINVPRLTHFAELTQLTPWVPTEFYNGIPEGEYIADRLGQLERAIKALRFPAIDWVEAAQTLPDPSGMLVSFEGLCRTKNGPRYGDRGKSYDFSDLKTAPHVYCKRDGLKLILPYDPKYMTTNTAMVEFSSGQIRLGGFALVKTKVADEIWASPYFIGVVTTPEVRALLDALSRH